jgi:hypothetical protein
MTASPTGPNRRSPAAAAADLLGYTAAAMLVALGVCLAFELEGMRLAVPEPGSRVLGGVVALYGVLRLCLRWLKRRQQPNEAAGEA